MRTLVRLTAVYLAVSALVGLVLLTSSALFGWPPLSSSMLIPVAVLVAVVLVLSGVETES